MTIWLTVTRKFKFLTFQRSSLSPGERSVSGGDHRSPHTRPHSPSAAAKRLKRNEPEDGNEDLVVDDNGDNNNQAPPMQNGNHHSPLSSNGGGENGKKSPGSPAGSESSSSSKKREDSGKKNLKPPTPTSKPMLPGLQIWFYDNTCKKNTYINKICS